MTVNEVSFRPAPVFRPLWRQHRRYKGIFGGRGSGKSHDRAEHAVLQLLEGARVVGVRETQRSIKDSVKQLIEDKISAYGLDDEFEITRDEIRSREGGLMVFTGLRDHSAESFKSYEGFVYCWVEEAQTITARSLRILTPTIRAPSAELWFTWNPRYAHDPVDQLFRGANRPPNSMVVQANYAENPLFPPELRADMEHDKKADFELYRHIWLGEYQFVGEGAYFAQELTRARDEDRIVELPIERGLPIFTSWDIGVDDHTAIWVLQPVGRWFNVIDFFEDRGEDAAYYCQWVKDNGYDTGLALLPHDAGHREKGALMTYEDWVHKAGVSRTRVLPRETNLMAGIQRVRTLLPRCVFRTPQTDQGVKALGSYRVEMDEALQTPKLRPVHDWSSHATDAFRGFTMLSPVDYNAEDSLYDPSVPINSRGFRASRNAAPNGRRGTTLGYNRRG